MHALRHAIANAFYALGRIVDAPVYRFDGSMLTSGSERYQPGCDRDLSGTVQLHLQNDTPVSSDFKPPEYGYTYASLHIGRGVRTTLFLTRLSTLHLIDALRHVERMFERYGEGRRS